jgi:hypothetical protein
MLVLARAWLLIFRWQIADRFLVPTDLNPPRWAQIFESFDRFTVAIVVQAVACRPMFGQARGSRCSSLSAPSRGYSAKDVVWPALTPTLLSSPSPLLQLKRMDVFSQECARDRMQQPTIELVWASWDRCRHGGQEEGSKVVVEPCWEHGLPIGSQG